jgi:hypothetical protein
VIKEAASSCSRNEAGDRLNEPLRASDSRGMSDMTR